MATTIVHIGTPKTATTYIQLALELNRVKFTNSGWQIPNSGSIIFEASDSSGNFIGKTICHHSIAWSLQGDRPLPFGADPIHFDQITRELSAELFGKNSIITSECLYWEVRDLKSICQFKTVIPGDAKIVVWLRNRWDFIDSMYTQAVYDHGIKQTLDDYIEDNSDFFDYGAALSQWAAVFGAENILVRYYDSMQDPFLSMIDFLELGLDGWTLPSVDVNNSLPKAMVPILKGCNLDRARFLHLANAAKHYSRQFPKVRLLNVEQVARLSRRYRAGDAFLQTLGVEIGPVNNVTEYLLTRNSSEVTVDEISAAIGFVFDVIM